MAAALQRITMNLEPAAMRYDQLDGRPYLAVPMVMLTEGVHEGSEGPLLYPADELARNPVTWNMKPLVMYHPERDGQGVSACTPDVIASRGCGLVMHSRWNGKLRSEAWFDEAKVQRIAPGVLDSLRKGEPVNISTGLFTQNERTPGEWNGTPYAAIARNYQPDHVAILPDVPGACKDAGLLRNAAADGRLLLNAAATVGGMSFDNIRGGLAMALRAAHGEKVWVDDVYPTFVVFTDDGVGKLYRQNYKVDGGAVVLDGAPTEVVRVTEYRTPDGAFVGNASPVPRPSSSKDPNMDRKALADKLIANSTRSGFTEADRGILMAMPDALLTRLVANAEAPAPAAAPAAAAPAPAATKEEIDAAVARGAAGVAPPPADAVPAPNAPVAAAAAAGAPTGNAQPVTLNALLANADPALREVLTEGLQTLREQRAALIATIVQNAGNTMTADDLSRTPLPMLKQMAGLARANVPAPVGNAATAWDLLLPPPGVQAAPVANYAGAAAAPGPVGNAIPGAGNVLLPPPQWKP